MFITNKEKLFSLLLLASLMLSVPASGMADLARAKPGETLVKLSKGDFVYPRISPDGNYLAYSEVFQDGVGFHLLDIQSKKSRRLLSINEAKKREIYHGHVIQLKWLDNSELQARIHDGDVGITTVVFNAQQGKIVSSNFEEASEQPLPSAEGQKTRKKLSQLYPKTRPVVFENLFNNKYYMDKKQIIFQKNYADEDNDIWLFKLDNPEAKTLVKLPEKNLYAFGGGVQVADKLLFSVRNRPAAHIYQLDGNTTKKLATIPQSKQTPELVVREQARNHAWFLIQAAQNYEIGNNPAYLHDGEQLVALNDFKNLYDLDVSVKTGVAVFSFWQGNQRHLLVRKLKKCKHSGKPLC